MKDNKVHLGYKSMILLLAITLLLPSTVKFAHAFADHKHEVCKFPQSTHYHEYELDCEFYKFKINPQISFDSEVLNDITSQALVEQPVAYYSSVKKSHVAAFRLRGPPIKI
jgi:hypothetical protein